MSPESVLAVHDQEFGNLGVNGRTATEGLCRATSCHTSCSSTSERPHPLLQKHSALRGRVQAHCSLCLIGGLLAIMVPEWKAMQGEPHDEIGSQV